MTEKNLSGAQLEKLGERLRKGPLTLSDLQQLRSFLETLEPFAEDTFGEVRSLDSEASLIAAQVTRRNAKTVRSIIAKLRRQSTSLRQIQDLVGCRIVVPDIIDQQEYRVALARLFPTAQVVDRAGTPQRGYRAVHIIVREGNQRFEIQLRTQLQDEWANIVEKLADRLGLEVKYGGGDRALQAVLEQLSAKIAQVEEIEESFRVRIEEPTSTGPHWIRLWYNTDFVSAFSREPIPLNTALLVLKSGEGTVDRAIVEDLWNSWEAPWGTAYDYEITFEGGLDVPSLKYEPRLSDAMILVLEIEDMIRRLEGIVQ